MDDVYSAFFEAAAVAVRLMERPEVAQNWDRHSVLPQFSVAGLSGHLLRALVTVDAYLDDTPGLGEPVSAAEYYLGAGISPDPDSMLNRDIRARGVEMSSGGAAAVAAEARTVLARLEERLSHESGQRRLRVLGATTITLEDYLRTRVVELVVHCDDLALSVGMDDEATVSGAVGDIAISTLVEVGRARHGDRAVLRALTRRERDDVDALRVL